MKKIYQNPDARVVILSSARHLLAGSTMGMQGDYNSEEVNIASRRGAFWDDEE